jgi:hypothetical protein
MTGVLTTREARGLARDINDALQLLRAVGWVPSSGPVIVSMCCPRVLLESVLDRLDDARDEYFTIGELVTITAVDMDVGALAPAGSETGEERDR